jgi:hypothetical protein
MLWRIDLVVFRFRACDARAEQDQVFYPAAVRVLVASRYDNKLKLKIAPVAERISEMHFMLD